ncbi:MAG: hypothetical protein KF861_04370, partial [Planctomycetaceae bacterium]|nr:hypothetical protein [Planctomycetaceae bacterium]
MLITGVFTFPDTVGYIVGAGWFVLVLLPVIVRSVVNRLLVRRMYGTAMLLAKISARLHPFDAWTDQPEIIQALWWYHQGKTAEATDLINRLGRLDSQ